MIEPTFFVQRSKRIVLLRKVEGLGPMKPWQPNVLRCGANSYPTREDKSDKKILLISSDAEEIFF